MASSVVPASTAFTSLLPRPPTPPRDTSNDTGVFAKSVLNRPGPSDSHTSLHTPPNGNTPTSSAVTDSNIKSSRTTKKVVWSAHTEYKEPVDYQGIEKAHKSSPGLAPSPASSKPIKGILKPSSSPNPLALSLSAEFDASTGQPNIIEMLDSTIKQLAGSDRDSKLDAYMMLSRALKASNNLPDRVALQDKMSLFMQFIQRDLTRRHDDGTLDTSLINHALTLLATFLQFPAVASTLTSDFGVFILDHSIRSFEDISMPKDVVRHLMQVVAFQNFSPKVMTSDRVGRLVTALHQIELHLKGKSIIMSRIHIYKRLVKQARPHMLAYSVWLKDMFTDMMSTIKDIRMQAVSLATEAGFALRSDKQLMRKTNEVFQITNEEQTYIEFFIHRLQEMLRDRQSSSSVPQIWSAVILFLRCPLERWQYYGPWLTLVQSAFNMPDSATKQEANYAWNRYVYLSLADTKISPKLLGTLCQPLASQLRRRANPKQLEEAMKLRRVVIGGICNLYYYTYAPGNDKYSPDVIWDVAVQPIMSQLINLDGKPEIPGDCLMQANRMLLGLLDVATPRVWRHDRIMETPPTTPDELPPIDSKWVRRNCDKVFQAVGPILEKKILDLANKESLAFRLWKAIVGSVAAASAKDIKVSEDTARFFAQSFGLLSKVWSAGITEDDSSQAIVFLSSIKNFLTVLVSGLGILPFTEKKLSMTVTNTFEPIATPSHNPDRLDKSQGVVRSPLHHLFSMLCSLPPGVADNDALSDFFLVTVELFFQGKSVKGRVELAHELLQLLPYDSTCPYGPWLLAAQNLFPTVDVKDNVSAASSADNKLMGPVYRDIVALLEQGLRLYPNLPSDDWFSLFSRLSDHVNKEFGDAGRALVLIEPIAKALLVSFDDSKDKLATIPLKAATALFESAKLPRDRNAYFTAKQRLWGAPLTLTRVGTLDPFDSLYKLGNQALEFFYIHLSNIDATSGVVPFIQAIKEFVIRSFSQVGVQIISKLQSGLCLWVHDEDSRLKSEDGSSVAKTLGHTWDLISAELVSRGQLNKEEFEQLEPLLTAAFQSKHVDIARKAVETWNIIAKDEDKLECSDSLKSVASSFGSKVELVPSGFEKRSGEFGAQASSFIRPPEDVSFIVLSSASSHQDAPQPSDKAPTGSTTVTRRASTRRRRMKATPEITRQKKSSKRRSTPRLRHDDSQIQFAPITSSSPQLPDESQHLTERQKEVRDRQRENAIQYSDIHTSSPAQLQDDLPKQPAEATKENQQPGETTPRRATSYDNHVSSTPTPRRGQVLQMDDNDPPSSPPVPRPYPLLSEIQSRSRANSAMENWEFSSPPGSPVAGRQQLADDIEMSGLGTENKVKDAKGGEAERSASAENIPPESMDVIPSSVVCEGEPSSDLSDLSEMATSSPKQPTRPTTPTRQRKQTRRSAAAREAEESPKSGDDEFVDARSSPEERPSPAKKQLNDSFDNDTSFALSEGDESRMIKLAAELESWRGKVASPQKIKVEEPHNKHSTVLLDEEPQPASPPRTRGASKRAATQTIPSTPAEPSEGEGRSKKKRKRTESKHGGSRSKKRRQENEIAAPVDKETPLKTSSSINEPTGSPAPSLRRSTRQSTGVVETRGSARKRQQQRQQQEEETEQATPRKRPSRRSKRRQGGDTDDELMSQLVTESNAASQSQSQSQESEHEAKAIGGEEGDDNDEQVPCTNDNDNAMEPVAAEAGPANATVTDEPNLEEKEEEQKPAAPPPRGNNEGNKTEETLTIMEALQNGLNQLRKVSLSREEVYKMEDVLMDMKRELFEAERRGRASR